MIKSLKIFFILITWFFVLDHNVRGMSEDEAKQADIAKADDAAKAAKAAEAEKQAKAERAARIAKIDTKSYKTPEAYEEAVKKAYGSDMLTANTAGNKKLATELKKEIDEAIKQYKAQQTEALKQPEKLPKVEEGKAPKPEQALPPVPMVPKPKSIPTFTTPHVPAVKKSKSVPDFEAMQKAEQEAKKNAEEERKKQEITQIKTKLKGKVLEVLRIHDPGKAEDMEKERKSKTDDEEAAKKIAHVSELIAKIQGNKHTKDEEKELKSMLDSDEIKDENLKDRARKALNILTKKQKGFFGITTASIITILLGGGGAGGGILGSGTGEDEKDGGITSPTDEPDPIYETPPTNDPDYDNKLYLVANTFAPIKEKFKEAIKNSKYENNTFEINLGSVTIGKKTENVMIKYTFEKGGAGSIDTPLNAVAVEVFPTQIDGFAVTPAGILSKIADGENKIFTSILFKPTSGLIFIIKMALLLNPDPSFNKDIDFANHVLLESILLLCRLKWDPDYKDLSISSSLFAEFPSWITDYLNKEKQGKMFAEMVEIYSETPSEASAIAEAISSIRQIPDYKLKVQATKETLNPLINSKVTYADKTLVTHSISRLVFDLSVKLPKTTIDLKKELSSRLNLLIPVLTEILELITDLQFEPKFVSEIETCLNKAKDLKAGKTVKLVKPLSGGPIEDVKNYSLGTVISTCMRHFSTLSTRKFKGDYGFLPNDFFLGRGETEDAMLAVWMRCMYDASKANTFLLETKEPVVEIRTFGGSTTFNPGQEKSELIDSRVQELAAIQKSFEFAKNDLKSNKESTSAKKNYRVLQEKLVATVQKVIDARRSFIRQYAVYYPFNKDDNTTQTVAEFAKREFANIKKIGTFDDKLFGQLADIFEQILGLPQDRIW